MTTSRRTKTPDVASLIASAKLPEKAVPLCLRGDLAAQVDELEAQIQLMSPTDRLTGNAEGRKLAERIQALRAEMEQSTVTFRLRALGSRAFQKFVAAHGPRDGNAEDKALGINTETYFEDLTRLCVYEPALSDEQWENLVENVLTTAQWRRLTEAATNLNIEDVSVPFSPAASLLLRRSDET